MTTRGGARWRTFVQTETGSAALLLAAVVAALLWANIDLHSYEAVWQAHFTIGFDTRHLSLTVHEWINAGLMSLFFFVVGLEARREFDMGELRDRRWVVLSAVAGLGSMVVPAVIYVVINAGHDSVHGWGTAMSTDTAFALGILAVLRHRLPASLRAFMLSISVVDDLVALVVIAVFYSDEIHVPALLIALGALLAIVVVLRLADAGRGLLCALLAVGVWVALHEAGIDPVVTGLAVGALVIAYPAPRGDLERASRLFRLFREQPTPELQRSAARGLASAISPNERLEQRFLPWVSFGIVPLFALANAGIELSGARLADAFTSPITLGILCGCVLGKIVGVLGSMAGARLLSGGRLRPNVGWGSVTAAGSIAGAAFTVSLLIAALAFEGEELNQARIGILATLLGSFAVSWGVSAVIGLLPAARRARALLGTSEPLTDLGVSVDERHDHVRGPADAAVTLVEYGDFECPYCGRAEGVVRDLLGSETDVRYVWRHLPLTDVHPQAQAAAEAAEAAARQGRFWDMHDLLLDRQDELGERDLLRHARELGLDMEVFREDLKRRRGARRIAEDVDSADLSGVSGTPTFFVNGRRHHGAYDIGALKRAVEQARRRALAGG
ncbi:Na+/H+ antiporter NhaA [Streptomyces parvulus]|uniref:Na(+)/H(+) antiporter NhaA n=1 Tax=Streptomyces parvulus TaxID=146923 RepID=A0A191USH1_9ACTN|nr:MULTISPECIES: Na+/H+ antiporter NhaA [Streptomyces]ANJ05650.1 sodium:proton antiporter [Streptomyces parvulus]MCC9154716.1 Na+/H+ antiporter NhaA [Streptomyces parvulus]MCE7690699.1 Na+/H+ antiporter NhaA [Streptomyces parvulus]MZD58314.1 thioredoxin domain-containing protein [Streptomyces sp. SID5606]GGR95575.1 Na(+)/H(+) antiporter NhaA 2 [Streptomyces parvulus]